MIETLTKEIMASQLSQWIQATYWALACSGNHPLLWFNPAHGRADYS